jgi:hypothetical protein
MRILDFDPPPPAPVPSADRARATPQPGEHLHVEVLGAGRQVARVESVEEMSYHGIPGFAWRVRVRLPDGIRVDGLHLRDGHMWFADPRVRPV